MNELTREFAEIDLLAPIAPEHPCGDNLEYDPDFIALQSSSLGKVEQQFGDAIIPAEVPDWQKVEHDAERLLGRTKDLRVMVLLAQAWTENEGLLGYARGLWLVNESLDRYWTEVHPGMWVADDYDPLLRINAITALVDPQALGRSVRAAPLLSGPFGSLALRDAAAILEGGKPSVNCHFHDGQARLISELETGWRSGLVTLRPLVPILELLSRLRQKITDELDASWVPNFAAVETPLSVVRRALKIHSSAVADGHDNAHSAAQVPASAPLEQQSAGACAPAIHSRENVAELLEHCCAFLEAHEPSHPAPLLLRRAQRLLHMDFYEIVRDLAPSGLAQIDLFRGPAGDANAGG